MSWLNDHLQTFVKPYLGYVPVESAAKYFSPEETTVIKNCWKSAKAAAQGRKILLAGRDVFLFEILARRENYPTLFLPQCSRMSVKAIELSKREKEELLLFDTGFMGSIPAALGIKNFKLISYADRLRSKEIQIFPHLTMSRGLALKIEKTPKYWKTGQISGYQEWSAAEECFTNTKGREVTQEFSNSQEFQEAAKLTMEFYKNSAPRFIDKRAPLGKELLYGNHKSFGF